MESSPTSGRKVESVRVWDLPTRLFHWLLVVLFALSWWSGETRRSELHTWAGCATLSLVIFRLYWGVAGSATARLAQFVRGPAAVWAYARGLFARPALSTPGHNPLGGWSVVAMLTLLLVQALVGLFGVDVDGQSSGPLSRLVTFKVGRGLAETHAVMFDALLVVVGLHVAAILFYLLYKRENLITAMFTGKKRLAPDAGADFRFASSWHALAALCAIAGLVALAVGWR
jgi:cytochrome b